VILIHLLYEILQDRILDLYILSKYSNTITHHVVISWKQEKAE